MKHIKKGESSAFAMNFSLCLVVDMRLTSSHRHLLSLFSKKKTTEIQSQNVIVTMRRGKKDARQSTRLFVSILVFAMQHNTHRAILETIVNF